MKITIEFKTPKYGDRLSFYVNDKFIKFVSYNEQYKIIELFNKFRDTFINYN